MAHGANTYMRVNVIDLPLYVGYRQHTDLYRELLRGLAA